MNGGPRLPNMAFFGVAVHMQNGVRGGWVGPTPQEGKRWSATPDEWRIEMDLELTGKRAIVTGGSVGIGKAPDGITVNLVHPGATRTDRTDAAKEPGDRPRTGGPGQRRPRVRRPGVSDGSGRSA